MHGGTMVGVILINKLCAQRGIRTIYDGFSPSQRATIRYAEVRLREYLTWHVTLHLACNYDRLLVQVLNTKIV